MIHEKGGESLLIVHDLYFYFSLLSQASNLLSDWTKVWGEGRKRHERKESGEGVRTTAFLLVSDYFSIIGRPMSGQTTVTISQTTNISTTLAIIP